MSIQNGSDVLVTRFGRYVTTAGALLMAGGLVVLLATMDTGVGFWDLAPWQLICDIGMGGVIGPIFAMAGAEIDPRDAGAASGTLNAGDQLGSAVGIALLGVLFFNALGPAPDAEAYLSGFGETSWYIIGALVLVSALSLLLPRRLTVEQLNQAH
jgi:hypothetical protein